MNTNNSNYNNSNSNSNSNNNAFINYNIINPNDKLQVLQIRQKALQNQKILLEQVLKNLIEEKATAAIMQASRSFLKPYTTTIQQIKKQTKEIIEELEDIDTLLRNKYIYPSNNIKNDTIMGSFSNISHSYLNHSLINSVIEWYSKICSALYSFNNLNLDTWYHGINSIRKCLSSIAHLEVEVMHYNKIMSRKNKNIKSFNHNNNNNNNISTEENKKLNKNFNLLDISNNRYEDENLKKSFNDIPYNPDNNNNNNSNINNIQNLNNSQNGSDNNNNLNINMNMNININMNKINSNNLDDYNNIIAIQPYYSIFLDIYTDQILKSLYLIIKALFVQLTKKQSQLTSTEINNISIVYTSALDTMQGLFLLNQGNKSRFYNPEIISILLNSLDINGNNPLRITALETLQIITIRCSTSVHIIEQQQGLYKIIGLLKRRDTDEYIRLKLIEFLYIYLSNESTDDPYELNNRKESLAKLVGINFVNKLSNETDLKKIFGKKAQEITSTLIEQEHSI